MRSGPGNTTTLPLRELLAKRGFPGGMKCRICDEKKARETHHVLLADNHGRGIKPPDFFEFPICIDCHRKCHISVGHGGIPIEQQCLHLTSWLNLGEIYTKWAMIYEMTFKEFVMLTWRSARILKVQGTEFGR